MMLDTLLDYLADMAVLYGRAVVYVDIDGVKHRVTFLEGESGHPNVVTIKAKRIDNDFERG